MNQSRSVGRGDALREITRERDHSEAYGHWIRMRASTLVDSVTAHDILRHFNINLKFGDDQEEQISCPFHGADVKPSARVYPAGASRSGLYCWVCQKRWDIFGIWKQFHGDDQMKFTEVVRGMEGAFGIIPPEMPAPDYEPEDSGPSERERQVVDLLEVCERRLRQAKPHFALKGFMTVGKILDQLYFALRTRTADLKEVEGKARMVLDKIGEKIRAPTP
jgi:hypothetical protein